MTKRTKNLGLIVPTVEEDAAIAAGIAQNPETIELTAAYMAAMKPLRRMGRSPVERPKVSLTVRVDADLLEAIKKAASGWQTRVNDLLRDGVRRGKLAV